MKIAKRIRNRAVQTWQEVHGWYRYHKYEYLLEKKKFVFLLCPPLSGSTLIKELIEGCRAVSSFQSEGQWLKGAKDILWTGSRWNPDLPVDWFTVRKVFLLNWDLRKPVLFEKSPPHLVRAKQIEQFFDPSYFIISIRNPYAQIEGLLRRNWQPSPEAAAEFWVKCAKHQMHNIELLQRNIFFSITFDRTLTTA